jgi:hypothetical protein
VDHEALKGIRGRILELARDTRTGSAREEDSAKTLRDAHVLDAATPTEVHVRGGLFGAIRAPRSTRKERPKDDQ